MASINLNGCNFYDQAKAIGNHYEFTFESADLGRIEAELKELKNTLHSGTTDYEAVETLRKQVKTGNRKAFAAQVGEFVKQVSGATLANLAGSYLGRFL